MNGDLVVGVIASLGAMSLVAGGLIRRRVPGRQLVGMALAWVGIFVVLVAVASLFR